MQIYSQINDFGEANNEMVEDVNFLDDSSLIGENDFAPSAAPSIAPSISSDDQDPVMNDIDDDNYVEVPENVVSDTSCQTIPPTNPVQEIIYRSLRKQNLAAAENKVPDVPTVRDESPTIDAIEQPDPIDVDDVSVSVIDFLPPEDIASSQLSDGNNNVPLVSVTKHGAPNVSQLSEIEINNELVAVVSAVSLFMAEIANIVPSPRPPSPQMLETLPIEAKKRRYSVTKRKNKKAFIHRDAVTVLDTTEIRDRLMRVNIDCVPPRSDIVTKKMKFHHEEATLFTEPMISGGCNRELFKPNLVLRDEEIDLSILRSILSIPGVEPDRAESRERENQLVNGDRVLRRSNRKRKSPEAGFREIDVPEMPELDVVPCDIPLDDMTQNHPFSVSSATADDQQVVDALRAQGDENFNKNDEMVLQKLRSLWEQSDRPVAMVDITSIKMKRIEAAKNFASILGENELYFS